RKRLVGEALLKFGDSRFGPTQGWSQVWIKNTTDFLLYLRVLNNQGQQPTVGQCQAVDGGLLGDSTSARVAVVVFVNGVAQLLRPGGQRISVHMPMTVLEYRLWQSSRHWNAHGRDDRLFNGTTTLHLEPQMIVGGQPGQCCRTSFGSAATLQR